jgi:hypothetical protein
LVFLLDGAKAAPSFGEKPRMTTINEPEVAPIYPRISAPMKKRSPFVLLGISTVFAVLAICATIAVYTHDTSRELDSAPGDLFSKLL